MKNNERTIPLDLYFNPKTQPELEQPCEISTSLIGELALDYWSVMRREAFAEAAVAKVIEKAIAEGAMKIVKGKFEYKKILKPF